MLKKATLLLLAAIISSGLFYRCKKGANSDTQAPVSIEAKFFNLPANANPALIKFAEDLKKNQTPQTIEKLAKVVGLPIWAKAKIDIKEKVTTEDTSSTNTGQDTTVIIPMALLNTQYVNGLLMATINGTISAKFIRASDYSLFAKNGIAATNYSAERVAALFMSYSKEVFGCSKFKITDDSLFIGQHHSDSMGKFRSLKVQLTEPLVKPEFEDFCLKFDFTTISQVCNTPWSDRCNPNCDNCGYPTCYKNTSHSSIIVCSTDPLEIPPPLGGGGDGGSGGGGGVDNPPPPNGGGCGDHLGGGLINTGRCLNDNDTHTPIGWDPIDIAPETDVDFLIYYGVWITPQEATYLNANPTVANGLLNLLTTNNNSEEAKSAVTITLKAIDNNFINSNYTQANFDTWVHSNLPANLQGVAYNDFWDEFNNVKPFIVTANPNWEPWKVFMTSVFNSINYHTLYNALTPADKLLYNEMKQEEDDANTFFQSPTPCKGTVRMPGSAALQPTAAAVHLILQEHYCANNPMGRFEYSIPNSSSNGKRGFADIVNIATGEIFEIKPKNLAAQGAIEAGQYVQAAQAACTTTTGVPFNLGSNYIPPADFPDPANPNNNIRVTFSGNGVITYEPIPRITPVPIPSPQSVKDIIRELKRRRDIYPLLPLNLVIETYFRELKNQNSPSLQNLKTAIQTTAVAIVIGYIAEVILTEGLGAAAGWESVSIAINLIKIASKI